VVPPPINLHFFPGGIYPQPATVRRLSADEGEAIARRLVRALESSDMAAVRRLVLDEPSGPLQRFALGQWLDQAGRHEEAARELGRARDGTVGLLAALPSLASLCRDLAGDRVAVIDTGDLYPPGRSIRERARELFNDSCHPSGLGHRLLAEKTAAALRALRRPPPPERRP
jgi:hypothetical protein